MQVHQSSERNADFDPLSFCRTVLCRNQFCQLVSLVLRLFWLILWQVFLYMFIVRTFQVVFCSVHTIIHVLQLHQLRSHCSVVTEKTDLQPKHTTKVCIMTSCRHSPVGPSLLRTSVAYTQFTPPGQADKTVMSAVWTGFSTRDCRRQKMWSLSTLTAIVQFTPPRQTWHRQDCLVASGRRCELGITVIISICRKERKYEYCSSIKLIQTCQIPLKIDYADKNDRP